MLFRLLAIITILPLGLLLSGCACPSGDCVPNTPYVPCTQELIDPSTELPTIALASLSLVELPSPTETYQPLDADTCKCRAATNLTTANLVELERHLAKLIIECDTKNVSENYCLDRDLLALRATGLRNEAAGAALEAFYQLAGLETQKQYLQLGIDEVQLTLDRINKFQEKGISLPEPIDRLAILSQLSELEDQKLQIDFLRIQLNGQLQKATGCPLDEFTFFWPQLDWQPNLTPLDVEAELAEGLGIRSDLRGISLVLSKLQNHTLPVARGVLKIAESTAGTVEPQEGIVHTLRCLRCKGSELPVRCKQLAMFYTDTEQNATAEIKSAAYQVGLQQQRVALAQQLAQQLNDRLRAMEETRDIEDISVFEISSARTRVYQAESKVLERIVQLRIATVTLKVAQGKLALECGYSPTLHCDCLANGACFCCDSSGCNNSGCSQSACGNATSACDE